MSQPTSLKPIPYDFAGVTMYRCPVCKRFGGTKDEWKMHMRQQHLEAIWAAKAAADQALKPQATLYDAEGKLVERMPHTREVEQAARELDQAAAAIEQSLND